MSCGVTLRVSGRLVFRLRSCVCVGCLPWPLRRPQCPHLCTCQPLFPSAGSPCEGAVQVSTCVWPLPLSLPGFLVTVRVGCACSVQAFPCLCAPGPLSLGMAYTWVGVSGVPYLERGEDGPPGQAGLGELLPAGPRPHLLPALRASAEPGRAGRVW